jgi:NADH dehydrogenase/NADH:ubiquinone oxidoreductase subunit G
MNPAPTKLQQIEAELAEIRKNIARLENAKPENIAKTAIVETKNIAKPEKKAKPKKNAKVTQKADQKFKNAINQYRENYELRLTSHWIEEDGSINKFYEYFHDYSISKKLAILELRYPNKPELIDKYLNYNPEINYESD